MTKHVESVESSAQVKLVVVLRTSGALQGIKYL